MRTAEAMARLVRADPVDIRLVANQGRSHAAQVALTGIFATPIGYRGAIPAQGPRGVSPRTHSQLVLAVVGVFVVAVVAALATHQLPRMSPRFNTLSTTTAGTPGTTTAGAAERTPSDQGGVPGAHSSPPGSAPRVTTMRGIMLPGATNLLMQVINADIIASGSIQEISSTPSTGPGDAGYSTFVLARPEILLGGGDSGWGASAPTLGGQSSVGEALVFRAVGFGVEDIGHRGPLAVGDQVVFIGTRTYPLGESELPGYWLLLGDYSVYTRGESGEFTRLAPVYDDPRGNSFTLPELREMLAPYKR